MHIKKSLRIKSSFLAAAFVVSLVVQALLVVPVLASGGFQGPKSGVYTDYNDIGNWVWHNPSNAALSDGNFVETSLNSSSPSHYLKAVNFNFLIPTSATINGIELIVERQQACGSSTCSSEVTDYSVRLLKNNSLVGNEKAKSDTWLASEEVIVYGSPTDLWGASWTDSDINSTNFGSVFSVRKTGSGDRDVKIDQMTMKIYYTTDTTSPDVGSISAKTSKNGTDINPATWQTDDDPYFSWIKPTEDTVGYFVALNNNTPESGGEWIEDPEYQFSTHIAKGKHTFNVRAKDAAGNYSGQVGSFEIWVGTPPSAPNTPDLQAASDAGLYDDDNITNINTPTFDISGIEAGNIYKVYIDGSTVADNQTGPTWTSGILSDDQHSITLKTVDIDGLESAESTALDFTIDTVAPSAPNALDMQAASDSGLFDDDNTTNIINPVFDVSGIAETYYRVYICDNDDCSNRRNPAGSYSSNPTWFISAFGEYNWRLAVVNLDIAGNESELSDFLDWKLITGLPLITLNGSSPINIESGLVYNDAGANALTSLSDDISALIIVDNPVDTSKVGSYIISYNVTDLAGNQGLKVLREVNVVDTTPPIISLNGGNVTIAKGGTYTELGATTDDNSSVEITGTVDTATPGTYFVYYNSSDASGNKAVTVIRTVNVENLSSVVTNQTYGDVDTQATTTPAPTENNNDEKASSVTEVKSSTDKKGWLASWWLWLLLLAILAGGGWYLFVRRSIDEN